ncbi:hypothetical protein V8D89_009071 [Ganoderma adspersum]
MDPFSSLQVPDGSQPGPSRHAGARPVSVQPASSTANSQSASRKRASHNVVTSQPQLDEQPGYRDIYSHPAALEYAAAHPRRTIPKFGPYLLLQTLGEGEFGKVKLGLHMQWGEEVAVKLIRRGNIDSTVRMSKVEREIEVLRTLKHPNIVRLYDVIETDKYIGIILEYASGGELFDHILAHRYLREKDACKLFSQLISGVWYIHQKKIVHRDLKLENLLLDRHRNVIITDFGFANRFEHRSDDLMQTSCGSPCYAAPELVISDGLYVGSAVDIWSCGVILYAMLAGYLPFDDDPANPDGDNINLLYKYIVNTPLSFPDYISEEARDLLSIMLVPDPVRRADLPTIMAHRWLAPYAHLFQKSVNELERTAIEQHHQKRLAYQRQMKAVANGESPQKMARSQSARVEGYGTSPPSSSSRNHRDQRYPAQPAQPEFLYETSAPSSSGRRGVNSAIVLPTSSPIGLEDDPFAPSPSQEVPSIALPSVPVPQDIINGIHEDDRMQVDGGSAIPQPVAYAPVKTTSPESKRSKVPNRHTIQVEYGESETRPEPLKERGRMNGTSGTPERASKKHSIDIDPRSSQKPLPGTPSRTRPEGSFPSPSAVTPVVSIEVTGPPVTPVTAVDERLPHPPVHSQNGSSAGSTGSASSKSRHRKGLSIDKIGISKIFGSGSGPDQTNGHIARTPSQSQKPATDAVPASLKDIVRRPSSVQVGTSTTTSADASADTSLLSPTGTVNSKKSTRRNTLTVMVAPIRSSIKPRSKKTAETPVKEKADDKGPLSSNAPALPPKGEMLPPSTPQPLRSGQDEASGYNSNTWKSQRAPVPASTVKASKVMQWFRSKSKGRGPADISDVEVEKPVNDAPPTATIPAPRQVPMAPPINTHLLPTPSEKVHSPIPLTETPSDQSFAHHGITERWLKGISGGRVNLRVHHGAVDQTTITTGAPPEVMKHVKAVLEGMGIDIAIEHEYKYRCIRPKKKRAGLGLRDGSGSLAAFAIVGSAASNGVDKRGLPIPSQTQSPSFGTSTGGMLRGLLMRRQSSQVPSGPAHQVSPSLESEVGADSVLASAVPGSANDASSPISLDTVYGDQQQDAGDEVRFSVELTRLDRLDDTYSLDIRRLKGNLRSYKFLYDTLRQRADLQR